MASLYLCSDPVDGFSVVKFVLNMKASSLRKEVVPYKYFVYSKLLGELNEPCEVLYDVPGDLQGSDTWRCLQVPAKKCHSGGAQKCVCLYCCMYLKYCL